MKRQDLYFIFFLVLLFFPFFISELLFSAYESFNSDHPFVMAFVKFSILATSGELLGLRIRTGKYNRKDFGILPRAIVWGILGILIKAAFVIFSSGVPGMLEYIGMNKPDAILSSSISGAKIFVAFSISLFLNLFFSPVLMTVHKITDTHIQINQGTVRGLMSPVRTADILKSIDWSVHWDFILKKTIPLFWIPAHTLTFLLPAEFQILFAAFLGIVLGVILAVGANTGTDK